MTPSPDADADVPAWAEALGIPGLFDVHVHFMPERIMERVWEHFDARAPLIGREWPIKYRGSDEQRLAWLRNIGVRRFSALPYAHKPGVADFMNDWARDFAVLHRDCLWSATFFPEESAATYVASLIDDGAQIFKVHLQVGAFDPRDPLLDPVWGMLADSGTPVVVHAGSGPVPGTYTGTGPIADVLRRHPRLPVIVAHMGAPEYTGFLDLAERYEYVRLDTTMAFTDFFEADAPFPPALVPRLVDLEDRVLLGSDFPNIPYAYAHQVEALVRLDLGDDWLRSVCWHNGATLFGENAGP